MSEECPECGSEMEFLSSAYSLLGQYDRYIAFEVPDVGVGSDGD